MAMNMITSVTNSYLKDIDLRTVDKDTLVDISNIRINTDLPAEQRLKQFIEQVKNPYCVRVGKVVVKNCFSETGPALETILAKTLAAMSC
jgi:hypothetical protein